jgi:hypothetical protein
MKVILGALTGAVIGFLLGYFGKCVTNTCPVTSNPYITAFIGALLGVMVTLGK